MIYLPPPQPVLNKEIRVSGDVEIHPTASLAPGVILQASSNNRIVVGADVCIGMGVIINACSGSVEIGSGAILGSGVLIIGASKIGNNSCIGTSSTIFQKNVAAMAVVEPGSIIGDTSRQITGDRQQANSNNGSKAEQKAPKSESTSAKSVKNQPASNGVQGSYSSATESPSDVFQNYKQSKDSASIPHVATSVESSVQKPTTPVVGQLYINELLVTLFPHRKSSNTDF